MNIMDSVGSQFTSFENGRKEREKGDTKLLTLRFVVDKGLFERRKKVEGMIKGILHNEVGRQDETRWEGGTEGGCKSYIDRAWEDRGG